MENALYIHIPFCRRKCVYCDFYSAICDEGLASAYVGALLRQIEALDGRFSTVYIGGGTPTVLDDRLLKKLLGGLKRLCAGNTEFTIEANPESVDSDKLKLLLAFGVNRISIGVQSLRDELLKKLGRIHNAQKAREAIVFAVKAGFKNISADIIFGVWGETPDSWKKEIREAAELPIQHISCYGLTYEKGTPLWNAVREGSIIPLEDDTTAAMYERAIDTLGVGGFRQYEVSNFAKEGFECRHNLNYWENNDYIGLGASAVSYIGGSRDKFVSDVKEYTKRVESGRPVVESGEKLSPVNRAKETAAVKIRTRAGIDFKWFREKTGFDFPELEKRAVEKLIEDDIIKYIKENNEPAGIALKRKGFLFCDTVSSALL